MEVEAKHQKYASTPPQPSDRQPENIMPPAPKGRGLIIWMQPIVTLGTSYPVGCENAFFSINVHEAFYVYWMEQ